MPGAADRLADDHAFGERPSIMRALRADGEQFLAAADENHRLVVDMAFQNVPISNCGELYAETEDRVLQAACFRRSFNPPKQIPAHSRAPLTPIGCKTGPPGARIAAGEPALV